MTQDDCYYLGYIVKPIGFKGAFQVFLDVSIPEEYQKMESVFVELDGQLVPFFISKISINQKGKARVEFEDINSTEEVKRIVGKQLYLPLQMLPKLEGNHFYHHEVQGFELLDQEKNSVGVITEIKDSPAQDLIVVLVEEKEVLIPILEDTIVKLDRNQKSLQVKILPGLLDMFLS